MAGGRESRRSMSGYTVAAHAQGAAAGDARMERYHEYVGRHRAERRVWPGAAFIVEALLLLVFLTGSLAVLMELNAAADAAGRKSADLMDAIVLASNAAEEFAADPAAFQEAYEADPTGDRWVSQPLDSIASGEEALVLSCEFSNEERGAGTLRNLSLQIWKERILTDEDQAAAEGIIMNGPDGVCFQRWETEPVYTLETTAYVPAAREGVATRG